MGLASDSFAIFARPQSTMAEESVGDTQVIATDHAVFNTTQKRRGRHDFRHIPNGVNGIEERLHVAWEELVNSGKNETA